MAQFWAVSSDPAERSQVHRARMELLIYYCNINWAAFWGQSEGLNSFLPLRGMSTVLEAGDKVLLDGWVLPVNQEFLWDKTTVQVLSRNNPLKTVPSAGKLLNSGALRARFVEMDALVDSLQSISTTQLKLNLLADNLNVEAFVQLDKPAAAWADLVGKIVHICGVYVATPDQFGKIASIALWTPGLRYVEAVSSLANDPRFSIPLVAAENFAVSETPPFVRVKGVVRSQQPGEAVTIWDATGQIRIQTKQLQPLQLGDHVQAVGYASFQGLDRVLQTGLVCLATNKEPGDFEDSTNTIKLRLADQVRGLDQESTAQHPQASLQGLVTFTDAGTNFIFVQDSSGGIRVLQTRLQSDRQIRPGMLVTVEGVAALGDFAPVISNAVVRQTGAMTIPDAPLVSFEQALTGTEDGNWIQMRGYVRKATELGGAAELQLVAPGGEFIARVAKEDVAQAPPGAVVLVRGVCVAVANSRRQLTGIEIWSSSAGSVQTEQVAPANLFSLPQRSIAGLRQFNHFNSQNKQVHTAGTVTLQVPGRYLYLQEGDNSLFALSSQAERLHPGDRVEIVGFAGHEGGNFLLREAAYRRIAPGTEPAPLKLPALQAPTEDLDGLLVQTEGLLLDVVRKPGETRLVVQVKGRIFEAKLDAAAPFDKDEWVPESKLAITGVYRIQRDESGKPLSFLLNLRNEKDIRVLSPPPWWTLRKVLVFVCGGLLLFVFAMIWAFQTRRKNRLLQQAQVELTTAHAKLEERVEERTRELNEEVEARKRALLRLSEAQQRLILASRQAGMAEVATGILHNVGNILNSVNISASMIGSSVQRLRIEKFCKAVELLKEHEGNWAAFFTDDPRGRALPGYLQNLAATMVENEQVLGIELGSLTKQIDHVKAVVAWQQGYARSSGFYESLNPVELMEDALQINQVAYERQGIEVVREFEQVPPITSDRHKIQQILINVLSNAQQALAACSNARQRVVIRIYCQTADQMRFEVSDTGVGIAPENLDRVFSLGFTTKLNGHGFGLHSGANSAKEMGGRLFATSNGPGCGATFILELPLGPKSGVPASVESEAALASRTNL